MVKREIKEKSEAFVFYETFAFTLKRIKNNDEFREAVITLIDYGLYGVMPENIKSDWTRQLMEIAVPLIAAAKRRRTVNIENGKKGGRPKKDWDNSQKPKQNQNETETKPNENLDVDVEVEEDVEVEVDVENDVENDIEVDVEKEVEDNVKDKENIIKEKNKINKTKNNNELIGNMVGLQEKTNSLIDSNVGLQEKNESNINEFDIKKKEEKDSAEKEERNAGAEQPAADAPSLEEAMDFVISVVKNAVERKGGVYNPNNERKFAKEILTSEEIKERRLEHYKPTLKEFLEATVYNSYVSYNQYIKVDSLFRLFYSYKDIYNNAASNEGRKTAMDFYFFHLPSSERQKKHNAIAKFISEKVPLPW